MEARAASAKVSKVVQPFSFLWFLNRLYISLQICLNSLIKQLPYLSTAIGCDFGEIFIHADPGGLPPSNFRQTPRISVSSISLKSHPLYTLH